MGVTIHFEGKLKSEDHYDELMELLKDVSSANDLPYSEFEESSKKLLRVKNGEDWDYEGPVKGIIIQLAPDCEPLNFEFGKDLIIQEYCKTQFADIGFHIFVVELLRTIEQFFEELIVDDEGEYWETNDEAGLEEHIDHCFDGIEKLKKEHKNAEGPVKIENGRVIDLLY